MAWCAPPKSAIGLHKKLDLDPAIGLKTRQGSSNVFPNIRNRVKNLKTRILTTANFSAITCWKRASPLLRSHPSYGPTNPHLRNTL